MIAETLGGDEAATARGLETVLGEALEAGLVSDVVIANSENERRAIWAIREDVWQVKNIAHVLTFDVSLPIENMKAYAQEVCDVGAARSPARTVAFVFGHMADGNLHIVVAARRRCRDSRQGRGLIVYRPLAAIGGSVSAEHGIGLEKRAYLSAVAHSRRNSTMRCPQAGAGSQGHPESRQGVRMNQPAHLNRTSARSPSRPRSSPAAGTSTANIANAERAVREAAKRARRSS